MYKPQSPLFATYPMVEYYHYSDAMEENARLKAEVERLRKAGDEVCEMPYLCENDPAVIAWRAATEGKSSV